METVLPIYFWLDVGSLSEPASIWSSSPFYTAFYDMWPPQRELKEHIQYL
jgi:hypothetical protein